MLGVHAVVMSGMVRYQGVPGEGTPRVPTYPGTLPIPTSGPISQCPFPLISGQNIGPRRHLGGQNTREYPEKGLFSGFSWTFGTT